MLLARYLWLFAASSLQVSVRSQQTDPIPTQAEETSASSDISDAFDDSGDVVGMGTLNEIETLDGIEAFTTFELSDGLENTNPVDTNDDTLPTVVSTSSTPSSTARLASTSLAVADVTETRATDDGDAIAPDTELANMVTPPSTTVIPSGSIPPEQDVTVTVTRTSFKQAPGPPPTKTVLMTSILTITSTSYETFTVTSTSIDGGTTTQYVIGTTYARRSLGAPNIALTETIDWNQRRAMHTQMPVAGIVKRSTLFVTVTEIVAGEAATFAETVTDVIIQQTSIVATATVRVTSVVYSNARKTVTKQSILTISAPSISAGLTTMTAPSERPPASPTTRTASDTTADDPVGTPVSPVSPVSPVLEKDPSSEAQVKLGLGVGIGVFVAVAAVIAVLVLFKRRRKTRSGQLPRADTPPPMAHSLPRLGSSGATPSGTVAENQVAELPQPMEAARGASVAAPEATAARTRETRDREPRTDRDNIAVGAEIAELPVAEQETPRDEATQHESQTSYAGPSTSKPREDLGRGSTQLEVQSGRLFPLKPGPQNAEKKEDDTEDDADTVKVSRVPQAGFDTAVPVPQRGRTTRFQYQSSTYHDT